MILLLVNFMLIYIFYSWAGYNSRVIVVVGAGPTGIYIAKSLLEFGHKVVLVESGNFETESSLISRDSYFFESESGMPLNVHRVGGGSNYWHARFGEFLEEDFQAIESLNIEGWPYSKSELAAHYKRISRELSGFDYSDDEYLNLFMSDLRNELHPDLDLRLFRFAEDYSFRDKLRELQKIQNFTLITECRVDSISPIKNSNHARYTCHLSSKNELKELHATNVIICAGALQSTKIILKSKNLNGVTKKKNLGHGLMEHIEGFVGTIKIPKSHYNLKDKFLLSQKNRLPGINAGIGLRLKSTFPSTSEIPSLHIELRARPRVITTPRFIGTSKFPNPLHFFERAFKLLRHIVLGSVEAFMGFKTYGLWAKSEEFKNPHSRVYISMGVGDDVLAYAHRVSQLTYSKFFEALGTLLPKVGEMFNADIVVYEWVKAQRRNPKFEVNWHPMGTMPMGVNANFNACDPALQLHSNEGIYIVSAAVFNRGSNGNPTFTTLALASKLVEEKFSMTETGIS